jgi:hypothetical protein
MTVAEEPRVRFGFVELLFALTAAEIAIQFAEIVSGPYSVAVAAPAYAHLLLALVLVTASWVGWSVSNAPGARRDVKTVFSVDYIILLIDVCLVVLYFIVVKSVDLDRATGLIKPSAGNESFWICVIFVGYFFWDVMTRAVQVLPGGKFSIKLFDQTLWRRGWASFVCALLAAVAWYFLQHTTDPTHVIVADVALIALVLLFRALRQPSLTWKVFLLLLFVASIVVVARM